MSYQIADQPVDSALRDYVVRPHMPLLASMLCGAWLAWPWFAFNAYAMGSPTRKKELALAVAAFAGTLALAGLVLALFRLGVLPDGAPLRLALLAITTCKLAFSYHLSILQERTFHVYEYYGGPVRDARRVISAGWLASGFVIGLSAHPLWRIIVSGGLGTP
ncbi:MAG TPA: hypothetical protein VFK02_28770 [Kofleriaceae bacterium]|nr:hypothetical protein [Kofleriaceae bacterium]